MNETQNDPADDGGQSPDQEPFRLENHKPAQKPEIPTERRRQRTLFAGLDCLPGQQDLFPTDGEVEV